MRKNLLYILLFLCAALLSSCDFFDDTVNEDVKCFVDDQEWKSSPDNPYHDLGSITTTDSSSYFEIKSFSQQGSFLGIKLIGNGNQINEGESYSSSEGNFVGTYMDLYDGGAVWTSVLSKEGSITIYQFNETEISGIFRFDAEHPSLGIRQVRQGSFHIVF